MKYLQDYDPTFVPTGDFEEHPDRRAQRLPDNIKAQVVADLGPEIVSGPHHGYELRFGGYYFDPADGHIYHC